MHKIVDEIDGFEEQWRDLVKGPEEKGDADAFILGQKRPTVAARRHSNCEVQRGQRA
jgi:hypothetical protein